MQALHEAKAYFYTHSVGEGWPKGVPQMNKTNLYVVSHGIVIMLLNIYGEANKIKAKTVHKFIHIFRGFNVNPIKCLIK